MASKLVEAGERDEKETREVRVRVEPLTPGASHDKALLLRNTVLGYSSLGDLEPGSLVETASFGGSLTRRYRITSISARPISLSPPFTCDYPEGMQVSRRVMDLDFSRDDTT